jgi:L-lactate dehydrogenase complex protein LldG
MPIEESLFQQFKRNSEALPATLLRAGNAQVAAALVVEQLKELKPRQVVASSLSFLGDHIKVIGKYAASQEIDFSLRLDRDKIEQAQIGISQCLMGIAQLGSLFHDASQLHTRLVSMLPPIHFALVPTHTLVATFSDALQWIQQKYDGHLPPYLSFITGPSKTADIERQLTIGVHGPGKLIILCIDNPEVGESHV